MCYTCVDQLINLICILSMHTVISVSPRRHQLLVSHLVEVPVEGALIVDHGGDEAQHQAPAAPRLAVPVPASTRSQAAHARAYGIAML
jgi:hypothetical protein